MCFALKKVLPLPKFLSNKEVQPNVNIINWQIQKGEAINSIQLPPTQNKFKIYVVIVDQNANSRPGKQHTHIIQAQLKTGEKIKKLPPTQNNI